MEATPGPWHPDTYNAINNLALLLAKQGRVVESEALYRRALEGLQTQRGPDHFDTLNALWNLGLVVDSLGTGNQQTSDGAAGVRASRSPSDYDREAEEVFSKAVDVSDCDLVVGGWGLFYPINQSINQSFTATTFAWACPSSRVS